MPAVSGSGSTTGVCRVGRMSCLRARESRSLSTAASGTDTQGADMRPRRPAMHRSGRRSSGRTLQEMPRSRTGSESWVGRRSSSGSARHAIQMRSIGCTGGFVGRHARGNAGCAALLAMLSIACIACSLLPASGWQQSASLRQFFRRQVENSGCDLTAGMSFSRFAEPGPGASPGTHAGQWSSRHPNCASSDRLSRRRAKHSANSASSSKSAARYQDLASIERGPPSLSGAHRRFRGVCVGQFVGQIRGPQGHA